MNYRRWTQFRIRSDEKKSPSDAQKKQRKQIGALFIRQLYRRHSANQRRNIHHCGQWRRATAAPKHNDCVCVRAVNSSRCCFGCTSLPVLVCRVVCYRGLEQTTRRNGFGFWTVEQTNCLAGNFSNMWEESRGWLGLLSLKRHGRSCSGEAAVPATPSGQLDPCFCSFGKVEGGILKVDEYL